MFQHFETFCLCTVRPHVCLGKHQLLLVEYDVVLLSQLNKAVLCLVKLLLRKLDFRIDDCLDPRVVLDNCLIAFVECSLQKFRITGKLNFLLVKLRLNMLVDHLGDTTDRLCI